MRITRFRLSPGETQLSDQLFRSGRDLPQALSCAHRFASVEGRLRIAPSDQSGEFGAGQASIVDFRLLTDLLRRVRQDGFHLLDASDAEFGQLAEGLGQPVAARRGGSTRDRLVPRRSGEAPERSLSHQHGLNAFPFHTDAAHHRTPPKLILMRGAENCESSTPTLLMDFCSLRLVPSDVAALKRESWIARGGPGRTFYTTILRSIDGQGVLRFDLGCMSPVSGTTSGGEEILSRAVRTVGPVEVDWYPGRVLILDNRRMLHARPIVPESERKTRAIDRVMLI